MKDRAHEILDILQSRFALPRWNRSTNDPFRTLIAAIISQNTTDKNTARAFNDLSRTFRITPEILASAQTSQIERRLKVAGLYRNKATAIKQTSRAIMDRFHGDLKNILSLPFEESRELLLQLPGVGPKTADVVLLFCAGKPTIPVDTHVGRVSKRLGLASTDDTYEMIRASLQKLYDPADYAAVHVLLIHHGREYCKARNPLCCQCPINKLCPSKSMWNKE